MHSLPEVLAELLRSFDIATDPVQQGPWPCFVGQLLTDPDNALSIADAVAVTDGRLHRTGETMGLQAYQVRIRSLEYAVAREKAWEISSKFDEIRRLELAVETDLYLIQGVHQENRPVFIGPDPNNRMNFVINGRASYRKVTDL